MKERHYYIPPDVGVCEDGTILQADWPSVLRLNGLYNAWVMSFTGFGMPPINYISQQGPNQHGSTLLDFRLSERTIQYIHRKQACSRDEYWDNRGSIINLLRPNRQLVDSFSMGRLRVIRSDGSTRDIKALINQGPQFSARSPDRWDERAFTEALRFKCSDPTWFDPAITTVTWTVDVISGLLFYEAASAADALVFSDTAFFSSQILDADEVNVAYTGTWYGYPTITIVGPIRSPKIENTTMGTKIELDYEVSVGETVTIRTDYGNKTITNQLGTNLIGTKTSDSDLAFYLAPDPQATGGVNVLTASGSGASQAQTSISLTYNTRYIGI